jgi:hypothetical protein
MDNVPEWKLALKKNAVPSAKIKKMELKN